MTALWKDIQYSVRMMFKQPGFTVVAVLSLALGIGANASIFTLLNTVLLKPLPVERPQELVVVDGLGWVSYPNYKDFRDRNTVLSALAAYRFAPMSLAQGHDNERIWGYLVTGNYFEMLGVRAARGRVLTPEDDRVPGAHPVAVVSHRFWQRKFNSDAELVGKTISLNNQSFTVIGIMPESFNGTETVFVPDVWTPMAMQRAIEPGSDYIDARGDGRLGLIGRLKPGVTRPQAQSALHTLAGILVQEHPKSNEGLGLALISPGIHPQVRGGVMGFAGLMMALVLLVLVLACTNLANLLLARSTERRKEIAIRLALGASRWRLVRQLVTESVMLSLVGGAFGLALAMWLNDAVAAFKPPIDFSLAIELPVDGRVLLFTLLLSCVTGLVFGIVPAWQATRPDLVPALRDQASLGGFRRSPLRNALISGQMALSLLLLICAGLMLRSLQQASTINPGFQVERAVAMSVDVGLQGYDETRGREFYRQLTEQVRALPEVENVTLTGYVPLSLGNSSTSVYAAGQRLTPGAARPDDYYSIIGLDYFRTMKIPLVQGREFDPHERQGTARVCIINETLARRLFDEESAIGQRVSLGDGDGPFMEVVGVAQDGKYVSLGEDPQTFIYFPLLQRYTSSVTLVARTRAAAAPVIPTIRRELQSLDATLPVYDVKTLEEHLGLSLFPARAAAVMLSAFGLLALLLAALGIYGVMSYAVAGRTREIGVRMALGAQVSDVLRLILRQGMMLVALGIMLGLVAAFAATRFLSSLLYGVSASDPLTFAVVTLVLMAVALLACLIPARRATKVDPMVALRCE